MSELLKLLESGEKEVKAGLPGKSHDDLLKLKAGEQDGKKRTGVLAVLDKAIAEADAARAGGIVAGAATHSTVAADFDTSAPAQIAAAETVDTSGAPQQIVPDVDLDHPAVDADPRAGTTEQQNRIDFNDPTKSGSDAVTEMLKGNAR